MKKILVIMTGGTICSFAKGYTEDSVQNVRSLDESRSTRLLTQNYYKSKSLYKYRVNFETESPINTFSENMTPGLWNGLLGYLKTVDFQQFSGVIIAHGTDTLAYTSALLALALTGIEVPVFVVSSNHPIDGSFPASNGSENFNTAVDLICENIVPGVYVPYKNTDGKMYIHNAAHINQCGDYTENFYSKTAVLLDDVKNGKSPCKSRGKAILNRIGEIKDRVLVIKPYVGIDYNGYDLTPYSAVLHGTYHSGTVITSSQEENDSVCCLIKRCSERNISLYLAPCKESGDIYDSLPAALSEGAKPIFGATFEMSYVKLLVSFAMGLNADERESFLKTDVCGENIY